MRLKTSLLSASAALAALLGVAACQTYDFEPVEPLALAKTNQVKKVVARKSKPNLMLLVDKSGSMVDPAESPSRLSELKRAMVGTSGDGFLTNPATATVARMGLAVFPTATSATNEVSACQQGKIKYDIVNSPTDDESALATASQQIASFINGMVDASSAPPGTDPDQLVIGGTPTAASLALLGTVPSLVTEERDDFILLLTDGLPNCNGSLDRTSCTCVDGTTSCASARNCLDQSTTVQQVSALAARGIRTIVVGFGAATSAGLALAPLNAMAEAGGMPRKCVKADGTVDASLCGAESCDTTSQLCATRFYKAKNAAELAQALAKITTLVGAGDPCEYALDSLPSQPELLQVIVNGQVQTAGADTWSYASGKVKFQGALCTKLNGATPTSPVDVEFGIIQTL
jgi:hypothetical protein